LVSTEVQPGEHVVRIPPAIVRSAFERLVFSTWADGYEENVRSVRVQSSLRLQPIYLTEYPVRADAVGIVYGTGWYVANSTATLEAAPLYMPVKGWLGELGLRLQFSGWEGWPSNSRIISLKVTGPVALKATWALDQPSALPLLIAISLLVASITVWVGRPRLARSPS